MTRIGRAYASSGQRSSYRRRIVEGLKGMSGAAMRKRGAARADQHAAVIFSSSTSSRCDRSRGSA